MLSLMIFLHILGTFGFLVSHGVSMMVAFVLPRQPNAEKMRALLDLSSASYGGLYGSLGLLLISGVLAGVFGKYFGQGWIWVSLGLLLAIIVTMYALSQRFYSPLKKALGLEYMQGNKMHAPEEPASFEVVKGLAASSRPDLFALVGILGLVLILVLMVFKPF
jgi:hypothetical protein